MKRFARFLATLVFSFVIAEATALACYCGVCAKTASATVIGPEYPAGGVPVTYTVTVGCDPSAAMQCDTISSVVDTPFGGTLFEGWVGIGDEGGSLSYSYTVNFTWELCQAYGDQPAADGSIRVMNAVVARDTHWPASRADITCEREITCRPPIPPSAGCSRTPGYWKTHSSFGPAPYDATWARIAPAGAASPFFSPPGAQTWFEVLWTDSAGGNAYYILARSFIAAKLNLLAGASAPDEVTEALAWAEGSFFGVYTPAAQLPKAIRAQALGYAGILDNYNNGYIGPGHCP